MKKVYHAMLMRGGILIGDVNNYLFAAGHVVDKGQRFQLVFLRVADDAVALVIQVLFVGANANVGVGGAH